MNKLTLLIIGIVIFLILLYASMQQGKINKAIADMQGNSELCIDGVKYLQFPSGASVKYQTNGSIALCN